MLKYLVILLDNTSISYCHYDVNITDNQLIPIEILKEGILFAMKNNLKIQYILPQYDLPQNYIELMDSMFQYWYILSAFVNIILGLPTLIETPKY